MSSHLLRSDFVPILSGYLILMLVLAAGLWLQRRRAASGQPATRLTGRRDHGWQALILHVLTDALAGYLVLMAGGGGCYSPAGTTGRHIPPSAVRAGAPRRGRR